MDRLLERVVDMVSSQLHVHPLPVRWHAARLLGLTRERRRIEKENGWSEVPQWDVKAVEQAITEACLALGLEYCVSCGERLVPPDRELCEWCSRGSGS